jgi:RNA polymerase sigma-70 factor (ECF subfamily)
VTPAAQRSYTGINSDDLMSLVAAGDQCGYDVLYETWRGALFFYFRCRTRNPVRSADLTQATFLKVWKQRAHWPPFRARGGSFRPWLYAIANNELIDECRSEGRNAATPGLQDPDAILTNVIGDSPTPEDYLIGKESRTPIRSCLSQLNPLEAQVLQSKIFEEKTLEQVGSVLWPKAPRFTAITNANRTLRKALLKLRRCLMTKGIESIVDLPPSEIDGEEEETWNGSST